MEETLGAPIEYCRKINAITFVYQPVVKGINRKNGVWNYLFIVLLWQEGLIINSVPANAWALNKRIL